MSDFAQLRHLGLFDARVPRYTSYPTAPMFSDRIGAVDSDAWMRAVRPGEAISLYVHIPFCRRLCWFCACRTQGTATGEPIAAYLDTLEAEFARIADALPESVTLSRLHWGGGTPTMLAPGQVTRLAATITSRLPFAQNAEFSVEIDPNEIDAARLDALAAAGMTRASIGVQDFAPRVQEAIGRKQSYEVTLAAVEALRARGIESLNVDLLYGLPFQTVRLIREGVEKVISLAPDRLALYGYAHVPWMARRQSMIPAEALPQPEERLMLFAEADHMLRTAGYASVGIDHFARPGDGLARAAAEGRLRRNFQGYTDDAAETLIGLGASAISRFREGYAQNASATGAYQAMIRGGRLATQRGHALSHDDRARGRIIEALMCGFAVNFAAVANETGTPIEALREMCAGLDDEFPGMVRMKDDRLELRIGARPLTRMIARHFDAYASTPAGFSQAV
jgi:oxygen-independent coproporphyrinogen-3 oxidase